MTARIFASICLTILFISFAYAQQSSDEIIGSDVSDFPKIEDPLNSLIYSVADEIKENLHSTPKPDSRAVSLNTTKILSLPTEVASTSLIFACQKSAELNMAALGRFYGFVPEITVPTTASGCFLPGDFQDIAVDSNSSTQIDVVVSKFLSNNDVFSMDRELLAPLRESYLNSKEALRKLNEYAKILTTLQSKYAGIYQYIETGKEYPAVLWPSQGVTSGTNLPWYLEACNWDEDARRLSTYSEFISQFQKRIENSGVSTFSISTPFRKFLDIRKQFGSAAMCSSSYRFTTGIDSHFIYGSNTLRKFVIEQPFAFLIATNSSIEWMKTEEMSLAKPKKQAENNFSNVKTAGEKILNNAKERQDGFATQILAARDEVTNLRSALASNKARIEEIQNLVPQSELKLEENLLNRAGFRATIDQIEERQLEIHSRLELISEMRSELTERRKLIVSVCKNILEDCEFESVTKKLHVWLDEIQQQQITLSDETNSLIDELNKIGNDLEALFRKIAESLSEDEHLRATILSATSGELYEEVSKLTAEQDDLKEAIAAKTNTIKLVRNQSSHLDHITAPLAVVLSSQ